MTEYAMSGDKEKFLKSGMNGYIARPVDLENLQATLAGVLRDTMKAKPLPGKDDSGGPEGLEN
jgi:CheY-like chemotaxis protein